MIKKTCRRGHVWVVPAWNREERCSACDARRHREFRARRTAIRLAKERT